MSDDEAVEKGHRVARELPETQAVFEQMKALVLAKWAATGIDDVDTREKYFAAVNAMNMVLRALNEAVAAGKLAEHSQAMAELLAPQR